VRSFVRTPMLLTLATALLGAGASTARADEHVLVLLDTTGSMQAASVPGRTRFDVAKERISTFLDTVPSQPTRYALWFFEGTSYTPIYDFTDMPTAAQVKAAVLAAGTGGVTPLAHSVCAAVDELINYLPAELHTKRIYMATDGEENSSPVGDQCYGPNSTTVYPTLTPWSWQWKVRNKACTGSADTPGVCSGGVPGGGITLIVDVDHLFDYVPSLRAKSASLETAYAGDKLTAVASPVGSAATTPAPVNADAAFFGGITRETRGRYQAITPSTPPAQATPEPGDANLDGCVDIRDRAIVLQQYGTAGSADFNRDGIVNIFDLQTVLRNYGTGCNVIP
jgi:hypothetical protein